MDKKKTGIPKLRFPGFTDPWEQHKLGEKPNKIGDGLHGTPQFVEDSDVYFVNGNNFVDGKISITKDTKKVSEKTLSGDDKSLNNHTILMSINGSIGNLAFYNGEKIKLGKSAAFLTINSFNKYFIYSFLETNSVKNYYLRRLTGTTIKNLGLNTIRNTELYAPNNSEQQRIGKLFNTLDSLITLHQRKLDHLKEQKTGLLQKMFPKNGETVPEVRFPGFTDAWEQHKLGDVVKRIIRKNKDNQSKLPLTISAQDGLIAQNTFFGKNVASKNLENYILLKRGEFAYNKSYSKGYPYGSIKRLNKYDLGVISPLYIAFKPNNINSTFLEHYYDSEKWYREIYSRAAEGARNHGLLNISPHDFFDGNICFPTTQEEQQDIGIFLQKIDTLITLHQRKLDHLKLLKKGLLQQMFV